MRTLKHMYDAVGALLLAGMWLAGAAVWLLGVVVGCAGVLVLAADDAVRKIRSTDPYFFKADRERAHERFDQWGPR